MIDSLPGYPSYERSAVPWCSTLPTGWTTRRLRHVAEVRTSNVDKMATEGELPVRLCNYVDVYRHDRIRLGLPFMVATATSHEIARFQLRVGDVVVTKDSEDWRDIGTPALVTEAADDLICGYHLAILRPHAIDGAYLHRCLQSELINSQWRVRATGVTRYGLAQGAVKDLVVPVPPSEDQAAIVLLLDAADAQIRRYVRAKEQLIRLLGEHRQALIDRAVTRGLDSQIALKASGVPWLGDVPEHWTIWRSKRLFRPRKELAIPGDVQLSATQAYGVIPQAEYEERIGRKVTKINIHLEKRRHVEIGDFVISMRSFQGGLERAWAVGCIRSSYVVLRPAEQVDVDFFSYVFKSRAYVGALQSTANFIRDGQDLNFNNFAAIDLAVPPVEEQRLIAHKVGGSIAATVDAEDRARKEIGFLRELRARLITDVVTGKVDVRQAAAALPEDIRRSEWMDPGADVAEHADDLDLDLEVEEVAT